MGIFNFRGEEKKESWMTEASEYGFSPSKRNFLLQKYTRCHLVWIHMLFLQKLQKKKKINCILLYRVPYQMAPKYKIYLTCFTKQN